MYYINQLAHSKRFYKIIVLDTPKQIPSSFQTRLMPMSTLVSRWSILIPKESYRLSIDWLLVVWSHYSFRNCVSQWIDVYNYFYYSSFVAKYFELLLNILYADYAPKLNACCFTETTKSFRYQFHKIII